MWEKNSKMPWPADQFMNSVAILNHHSFCT